MEEPPTVAKIFKYLGIAILVIGVAVGLYFIGKTLAKKYYDAKNTIPTPENNALIVTNQAIINSTAYNAKYVQSVRSMDRDSESPVMINYNMLGCRMAGYLGPVQNGMFDEEKAVQFALKVGCRVFMLPIGTMIGYESPVLVARAPNGDKISNNFGSVQKVAEALARNAPLRGGGAEPLIVILYFESMPGKNAYDPKSVKFMKDVAAGLSPLRDFMLGMTPSGDYRRQGMQDMLMLRQRSSFDGKVIIMTNVDTKAFREKNFRTEPALDLDLMTHARLFAETSTNLGLTGRPDQAKVITPRLETFDYFYDIPDTNLPNEVAKSKVQWSVAMSPNIYAPAPKGDQLKKLLDERGVSCIMVDICSDPNALINSEVDGKPVDTVFSKKYFGRSGFRLKPVDMRYTKPAPIKLSTLNKAADARGGGITGPKV